MRVDGQQGKWANGQMGKKAEMEALQLRGGNVLAVTTSDHTGQSASLYTVTSTCKGELPRWEINGPAEAKRRRKGFGGERSEPLVMCLLIRLDTF
jgi:hypothetical protein